MREAFNTFPFEAPLVMPMQVTRWGSWYDVNWIRKTLEKKGLEDVKVNVTAFLTHVDGVDAFIKHFDMMLDVVMAGSWSEELRKEHPKEEVAREEHRRPRHPRVLCIGETRHAESRDKAESRGRVGESICA